MSDKLARVGGKRGVWCGVGGNYGGWGLLVCVLQNSWIWTCKCPKHVEAIYENKIIVKLFASSWYISLLTYMMHGHTYIILICISKLYYTWLLRNVSNVYHFNPIVSEENLQTWCRGTEPSHSCGLPSLAFANSVFTVFCKKVIPEKAGDDCYCILFKNWPWGFWYSLLWGINVGNVAVLQRIQLQSENRFCKKEMWLNRRIFFFNVSIVRCILSIFLILKTESVWWATVLSNTS